MFSDLNIIFSSDENTLKSVRRAADFGYAIISLNKYHENLSIKTSKKNNPYKEDLGIPESIINSIIKENLYHGNNCLKLLTRFTTTLSDSGQVVRLSNDPIIQKYDIISVRPTTEKLFLSACKDLEIDIISINLTEKLDFIPKRSAINCAIKRGVYFEILYSPMIRDTTARRNTISNANLLTELTRGKNIIFSSGCIDSMELRSPYDVLNLGLLFGLNSEQCKNSLCKNTQSVLAQAFSRKSKGIIDVEKLNSLGTNLWKVPKYPIIKCEFLKKDNYDKIKNESGIKEPPVKKSKKE